MLFELLVKALLMAATIFAPIGTNNAANDESVMPSTAEHVMTFELPSFENLIELKEESEELWIIDLPEVEIIATYTGDHRYEATKIDGDIVAIMYLDEIVITADAIH